jgi:hypothetical protein
MYVIRDIMRLQRRWRVLYCEGKCNEAENIIGCWIEMYCEEGICASEEYMEIRFVLGDLQRHMELGKEI